MKAKLFILILLPLFIGCNLFKSNEPAVTVFEVTENILISDYQEGEEIFVVVEDQPKYIGDDEARIKFLANNIRYPLEAIEKGIHGAVFLTFVIEKDGSLTNIKVLRGIGGGCDEEAVRVLMLMPKWKPGYQRGKPVRVQYNMPIKFTIAD